MPLKWLHIAEVVAAQASGRRFRRIGLTGTRYLVESEVYPEKLKARGLEYLRPEPAEREEMNRIIMDELVYGVFKPEAIATFQRVMQRMKDEGCDAVVLGCTEIPLIMNDSNSPCRRSIRLDCWPGWRCVARCRPGPCPHRKPGTPQLEVGRLLRSTTFQR